MMLMLRREVEHREQAQQQLTKSIIEAQEEERKRVARELHDETGQALTAVMMEVAKVMDGLPEELKTARDGMATARSVVADALTSLRRIIFDIRPEVLDDLGLAPALRSYVKNRLAAGGVDAKFEYKGVKERLPSEVEVLLFRVVQEAVTPRAPGHEGESLPAGRESLDTIRAGEGHKSTGRNGMGGQEQWAT
jgi:signal transduction histidine kinase